MTTTRRLGRRGLLLGGAAVLGGAGLGGAPLGARRVTAAVLGQPERVPGAAAGASRVRHLHSAARGRRVTLAVVTPTGVPLHGLPVLLALHGRGSDALDLMQLGLQRSLTEAVGQGAPPFVLATVDGGDAYWHARGDDDPQAMLRDEVPDWLDDLGAGPVAGALGISMGSFGALLWARSSPVKPRVVVTISPAVFRSWGEARARHAFTGRADWERVEPLRHLAALDGSRLGVWCGRSDPFLPAAKALATGADAHRARFTSGGHTGDYWARVLPEALAFAGARVNA